MCLADAGRIEVVGLPLWHGCRLALDATIVSPLTRLGEAHSRADIEPGCAVNAAARGASLPSSHAPGDRTLGRRSPARAGGLSAGVAARLRGSATDPCPTCTTSSLTRAPTRLAAVPLDFAPLVAAPGNSYRCGHSGQVQKGARKKNSRWSGIIAVEARRASAVGEPAVHEVFQEERWFDVPASSLAPCADLGPTHAT